MISLILHSSSLLNSSEQAKVPRDNQMPLYFTHLTAYGHAGLCLDRSTKVKSLASPFSNHTDTTTVNTENKTMSHKLAPSPFLVLIIPYPILNLLPAKHFFIPVRKGNLLTLNQKLHYHDEFYISICNITSCIRYDN